MSENTATPSLARQLFNKVPEVTLYFWIIKILCTTVGETFSDFLDGRFNLGEANLAYIMGALLLVVLFFQFRTKRYVPGLYWLAVVLISIVGTLITDNLSDSLGVSLVTSTIAFSVVLAVVFAAWYSVEKTLSIESIDTMGREAFYWLTILFTFALGTAAGDLIALTRPLGASLGDLLSQARSDGGLGFGAALTSSIFLLAILVTVVYLAVTKKDVTPPEKVLAEQ